MAEERLEASAASERQQEISHQEKAPLGARERGNRAFRIITLIALPSVDRVLPLPFHGQRGQHVQLFARDTHVLAVERGR